MNKSKKLLAAFALFGLVLTSGTTASVFAAGNIISREAAANTAFAKAGISNSSQYIGTASAKSIALNHAGLSNYNVTFTKAKLTTEDGIKVYDVEFRTADTEYEYEINAKTGKIIEFSSEPVDED